MIQNDDRTPPKRIRITGLQEQQLRELVRVDTQASAMLHAVGLDAAEVPARIEADFVALTRNHNVHVAEADHVPAGFLAWRDESPGVAYLADIEVHPDYQRFGVATKLLEALKTEARSFRLEQLVVRCWERATWAVAFYRRLGFKPIDAAAPAKVRAWAEERSAGRPLTRPGEVALWAEIGPEPVEPDDEADPTDVDDLPGA